MNELSIGQHTDPIYTKMMTFFHDALCEVERARKKFPDSYGVMCALTEEVGELAKASMDEPWENVYKEAIQVAAMAARVAIETDSSLWPIREKRGADKKSLA